jgi:predicted Zn-dependent protease
MNARLEMLYRSGQFSEFLSQVVDRAGHRHAIRLEQDRLRNTLREELRRIESGNPELAVANLLDIARITQSPHAYLLLAAANMKAGEWETALTVLDVLRYTGLDLPEANLLKGFVHGYFNRFGQGKSCLQATVEQAPQLRLAWIALIEMAMAEGSNHEAARFLNDALRADPHNMHLLHFQLGLLLDQPPGPENERLPLECRVEVLA